MKPKTLLVLLILVVGLGAFIYFYERKLPGTEERETEAKKLLTIKTDDVTAITLQVGDKTVKLERVAPPPSAGKAAPAAAPEDKSWKMTAPIQARADRWAVERLVDSLANLDKQRELDASDRAELGLDKPRATVTLATAAGPRTIRFGAEVPAASAMAAEVEGEARPAIVASYVWSDLAKPPGDWRSKDVFTGQRDAIERLTLTAGTQKVLLAKRGDDFWEESPLADRADRDAVNRLLGELGGLQVAKFLDPPPESPAQMGLEPPQLAVEAVLKGQAEPFRLELGGADAKEAGKLYARSAGSVFLVDPKIAESIRRAPNDWRSPILSSFEVYRVDSANVDDGKGVLALTRAGSDWKRNQDKVSFTPVSDLLYALTGAHADKLWTRAEAEQAGAALAKPALTVKLVAADQHEETLTLYPALADGTAVATASDRDGTYLLLSKATAADIQSKLETLRGAEPLKERAEDGAKKP